MEKQLQRKPKFKVEIYRPDYTQEKYTAKKIVVFSPDSASEDSSGVLFSNSLIRYSFTESLNITADDFSFSLAVDRPYKNKSWLDVIRKGDLVRIEEFGEERYWGIVRNRNYGSRVMDGGDIEKYIEMSGFGMGGLLNSFKLIIDQFLYQGTTTAKTASTKFAALQAISENSSIKNYLVSLYENYFQLVMTIGMVSSGKINIGVKSILDHFIDYQDGIDASLSMKYPLAISVYQQGENSVLQIMESLCCHPINEFFGRFNSPTGKYSLVFRQAPFNPSNWLALESTEIDMLLLNSWNLSDNCNEIFTYYVCTLPGSHIDKMQAMVIDQEGFANLAVKDEDKWPMYGYNPLIVEMKYFDRSKVQSFSAQQLMVESAKMLKEWYGNNDKYVSGNIGIETCDPNWKLSTKNPRPGKKIKLFGGEFYVENSTHSFSYGGPMETSLNISRGYIYDEGKPKGPIPNIMIADKI